MFGKINGQQPSNINHVESTEHGQSRNSDATSRKRSLPEQVENELPLYAKKNKVTLPEQTASSTRDFFTAEVGGTSRASFTQPAMAKGYNADTSAEVSGDKSYDTDVAEATIQDKIETLRRKTLQREANSETIDEIETIDDIVEQLLDRENRGEAKKPLLARDVFALINAYPELEDYFLQEEIEKLIWGGMGPDSQTKESLFLTSVAIALLACAVRGSDGNSDTKFETMPLHENYKNMPLHKNYIKAFLKILCEGVETTIEKSKEENFVASQEYLHAVEAAKHLMSLYREHGEKFIEAFTIIQNEYDLEEATNSTSNRYPE